MHSLQPPVPLMSVLITALGWHCRKAQLRYVPRPACQEFYDDWGFNVPAVAICAGAGDMPVGCNRNVTRAGRRICKVQAQAAALVTQCCHAGMCCRCHARDN